MTKAPVAAPVAANAAPRKRLIDRIRVPVGKARGIALILLALFMGVYVYDIYNPGPLQALRLKTFDYYQQIKPRPLLANSPVVIVDIDEGSLAEIGQWPWPRVQIAEMVRRLSGMGAVVVGFDFFFPEADRMSGENVAKSLPDLDEDTRRRLTTLRSGDHVFAEAILESERVVLGQAMVVSSENTNRPPLRTRVVLRGKAGGRPPETFLPSVPGVLRNNAVIEPGAAGHGMASILPERDGVVRRVPAMMLDGDLVLPALSLEILRVAARRPTIQAFGDDAGIYRVLIAPGLEVPTDRIGRMWPYFSQADANKYVSAKDILSGAVDPDKIKGKLVLIGTSAEGLKDIKTVPTEPFIPGVEVHAQLIESILTGTFLTRPNFADSIEMGVALIGGLIIIILVPWVGARWTLLFFLLVAAATVGMSWVFFTEKRLIFDPGFAVISTLIIYITLTYTSYSSEEAQRRQTRDAFSKYLSPDMVRRVVENPRLLTLGGEKRDMTILFCDVRGFTAISELFDAEGLTELINRLLTPLTDIILKRRGTVDKYMGDCIMAFWNAPLDNPQHGRDGCRAALEMVAAMEPLNAQLAREAEARGTDHVPLRVGLGLNTGEAVVGNMGTYQRMDYSVLGDTVNTASRLESQTKTYGVDIIVGPGTQAAVADFATLELDTIQVKGKSVGIKIYALLGDETLASDPTFQTLKALQDRMLTAYRSRDWHDARKLAEEVRKTGQAFKLDTLCDLYISRIETFEQTPPPPDWDGVFVASTK